MLQKRSVSLKGHATSLALELEFWREIERLAAQGGKTLAAFIASVDEARQSGNLASTLRLLVLADLKARQQPVPGLDQPQP
jgi:predicted DNA-binding ribbon-helix-helix protein